MLVREKCESDSSVVAVGNRLSRKVQAFCDALPLHMYPARQLHNFSPAIMPDSVVSEVCERRPDIVHLHWLAEGFVRLESIAKFPCPIVWTLHDSWAFTGGCHLPGNCIRYQRSCGRCPVLGSSAEGDLSRRIWTRKRQSWSEIPIALVAPSRWLADRARSSSLFSSARIDVIPNGVDSDFFCPGNKQAARESLGFKGGEKVLLFGGKNILTDKNKGFAFLESALHKLPGPLKDQSILVVFGGSGEEDLSGLPVKTLNAGVINDDKSLVQLYRAADVFVLTSCQENLPNVVMESMSCGTPCVAFGVGGVPEMIESQVNGYICHPQNIDDLASAIIRMLEDRSLRNRFSVACRNKAEGHYSMKLISNRYLNLYAELLEDWQGVVRN